MNLPFFIVFEGIDGSGKTTLSKMLFSLLEEQGFKVIWLKEPSESEWGKKIRDLAKTKERIPIEEELKYFLEDRKWDVEHNIQPALQKDNIVILDRYYFSTACYQGARGLNVDDILSENMAFAPAPDLTLIIDVDVDTAMKRITRNREGRVKLFEKVEFLQKVRQNYLQLEHESIRIIDGSADLNEVFTDIRSLVGRFLNPG